MATENVALFLDGIAQTMAASFVSRFQDSSGIRWNQSAYKREIYRHRTARRFTEAAREIPRILSGLSMRFTR